MPRRNKQRRKTSNKLDLKNILSNIAVGGLLVLSIGFFISLVDNLFFDNGLVHNKPDLAKLITKTKYEEKTGHKITVEIHNGCGIPKLANLYTEFLRSEGFDVINSRIGLSNLSTISEPNTLMYRNVSKILHESRTNIVLNPCQ